MGARTILHVDLDAFFAAVEQRDRPELRGKPVIVGGGGPNQRGVVSTASYEARVFGVHSAMPLRTAGRLCPHGIFLPVDGAKYVAVSKDVMAILRRFTPLVEPISIDEAFLDVTGSYALFGDGETIARTIKDTIRGELGLTASVGVATTKLVAKIGSDLRKPDGLVVVEPGGEAAFLGPLPISRLWGVGGAGGGAPFPGPPADLAAVGRRREDRPRVARLRGADHRRPGRASARGDGAPLRQARRGARDASARRRRGPRGDGRPREVDRARAHVRYRYRGAREDRT